MTTNIEDHRLFAPYMRGVARAMPQLDELGCRQLVRDMIESHERRLVDDLRAARAVERVKVRQRGRGAGELFSG